MTHNRRRFLKSGLTAAAGLLVSAHTPYRQWDVYRMRHLLIGTTREDAESYPLGKQLAEILGAAVPDSSARVARARQVTRLASLLTTDQLKLALIAEDHLADLAAGRGAFADFGPLALSRLYRFGDLLLVARSDFPEAHAWIITHALMMNAGAFSGRPPAEATGSVLPVHPGALAALRGETL